jgi:hypothetical protein
MVQLVPNFGKWGNWGKYWGFLCRREIWVWYTLFFGLTLANDPARNFIIPGEIIDLGPLATAVGGKDISGNSNGRGHRQQSTIISSKDTVVVATAMETAPAGAAMTAAGTPSTAPGIGTNRIAFATTWEGCGCWL